MIFLVLLLFVPLEWVEREKEEMDSSNPSDECTPAAALVLPVAGLIIEVAAVGLR